MTAGSECDFPEVCDPSLIALAQLREEEEEAVKRRLREKEREGVQSKPGGDVQVPFRGTSLST